MINDKGVLNYYIESKKLITEARHDGQLVIFVGAGASICSGMPAGGHAVKEIAAHLGIYDELKPFKFMNYVSERYIKSAFYKADDGYISEFDMKKEPDESGKIIRNLAYEQYTMISLAGCNQVADKEET